MDLHLKGKFALITGGTAGIGFTIASTTIFGWCATIWRGVRGRLAID